MKLRGKITTLALIASATVDCGGHDLPPPAGLSTTTGMCRACDGGGAGTGGSGGTSTDGGAPEIGSQDSGGMSTDLGPLVVSDIPDMPCMQTNAAPVTVMESEPLLIAYDQAGVVDVRRFAVDTKTLAMLTFDADGAGASAIVPGVLSARSTADGRIAALTSDGHVLSLGFFDSAGQPSGKQVELTQGSTGTPTVATGPSSIVALWESNNSLQGRVADNDGQLGGSIDFGPDSCGASSCTVRAVASGRGFTVVWSRTLQDERTKTSWADIGDDGKLNIAKSVIVSDGQHRIIDLARTPSTYALLIGEGYPTRSPVVVFLDPYGNVMAPARRLLGSTEAWGVAAAGTDFAVTARLSDGRAALRSLTTSSEAQAPWACLDDSAPDIGFSSLAAIYGEEGGYGIVVRMTDGSAAQLRTDGRGMAR
jgi:hypothetical protein